MLGEWKVGLDVMIQGARVHAWLGEFGVTAGNEQERDHARRMYEALDELGDEAQTPEPGAEALGIPGMESEGSQNLNEDLMEKRDLILRWPLAAADHTVFQMVHKAGHIDLIGAIGEGSWFRLLFDPGSFVRNQLAAG